MKYMDWSGTIIGESYFLFMDFKTFLTARIQFYYLLFDDKNIATVMNWFVTIILLLSNYSCDNNNNNNHYYHYYQVPAVRLLYRRE